MIGLYLLLNFFVPIGTVFQADSTKFENNGTRHIYDITGMALWGLVTLQAENDVLRIIWWLVMTSRFNQLAAHKLPELKTGFKRGVVLLGSSLVLEFGSAFAFSYCTWLIMQHAKSILEQAKDAAALSIILMADEALMEMLKFERYKFASTKAYSVFLTDPCKWCAGRAEAELEEASSHANKIAHRMHDAFMVLVFFGMLIFYLETSGSNDPRIVLE
ncbi:unnamed protein product [Polarella glacialis]|uniref:Uncharacterized protein n=1 Tax=Polarella glacialis TaxID=89957 RepID=A0A813G4K9_POLGL|nr:unnamed protein product [Polarella glacialis]